MTGYQRRWKTVDVRVDQGIAWVIFSRPEKRNAMSPAPNSEMIQVLEALGLDVDAKVLVLIGAGNAWTAGVDLEEYFREVDAGPKILQEKVRRDACQWQWKLLRMYAKPAITVVSGWCLGDGFSPLVACNLAIAADEATFGLSEVNWGVPPGSLVSKAMADTMGHRQTLYYITTDETSTGQQAAATGLVGESTPRAHLHVRTITLAEKPLEENLVVLHVTKRGLKRSRGLTWEQNEDYLYAKLDQATLHDPGGGREQGLKQFLDGKSIKPGLQAYKCT